MIDLNDMAVVCQVARSIITTKEVAEAAADNKAVGAVARAVLADHVNPKIVVGHMIVAVYFGSEQGVKKVQDAINAIGKELK